MASAGHQLTLAHMFRVEALRVQLVERCSPHARTIPHIPIPTRALTGMDFLVGSLTPSSQRIVTRECFDEIVDSKFVHMLCGMRDQMLQIPGCGEA